MQHERPPWIKLYPALIDHIGFIYHKFIQHNTKITIPPVLAHGEDDNLDNGLLETSCILMDLVLGLQLHIRGFLYYLAAIRSGAEVFQVRNVM